MMKWPAVAALLLAAAGLARAEDAGPPAAALTQLRHVIGTWDVRTEFLNPDGNVARAVDGTYGFEWVNPDRLARGTSRIPTLEQVSAILFYLRPAAHEVEMVSVGKDGDLWVMTGKDNEEVRTTPDRTMSDGSKMRLRFTRYDVQPGRFQSKMEYSTDGGKNWTQGNRQLFVRRKS
jgi:hypothetical protein